LGAQAVSPNLCYFNALYLRNHKNRTVIGSSYGCAKTQQSQAIKPAMSGDLNLAIRAAQAPRNTPGLFGRHA
jgi:hypothetical protein